MEYVFLGGAFFNTEQSQIDIYPYISKILKEEFPNKIIVNPIDIDNFKLKYETLNPNCSQSQANSAMVKYDLDLVRNSHLFIANVSNKSSGLGIELGVIIENNINIELIAKEGSQISSMVTGAFPDKQVHYYKTEQDLPKLIKEICKKYK